jgi:hypothetical protein
MSVSDFVSEDATWFAIFCRTVFLIILLYFASNLLFSSFPWIFIDGVNLLIHESGHMIFYFGGHTFSYLGGTLVQLLVPSLFLLYFINRKDITGSVFSLFWIGDNFVNVGIYIKDAGNMLLPLVGGGSHDWNTLLSEWNLLDQAQLIGNLFRWTGNIFVITSIFMLSFWILMTVLRKIVESH